MYGFLVPVLGGALALLALDERLGAEQVIGSLLVLAGLVVARLSRGAPVRVRRATTV